MAKDRYRFSFFRAGGVDQVVLNRGEDIAHLDQLDRKLWLALSCPTRGLELDSRTLDLVDTDHDGHIRPAEVLAAVGFVRDAFKNLDELLPGEERVPLSAINPASELGKLLAAEAKHILENLGRPDADRIGLDDIADTAKILAATRFNGDGVLPPESAGEEATAQVVRDIVGVLGGKPDRSGKDGVDQPTVDRFFDEVAAYVAWLDQGDKDGATRAAGADTAAAAAALLGVQAKVDDYFARCRLAAFDGRAAAALNPAEATLQALASKTLSTEADEIAQLPLASIAAGRPLPLGEGLNPAWSGRIATLAGTTVHAVLAATKTSLSEPEWMAIKEHLAPYFAWQARKPASAVGALPAVRLRQLGASNLRAQLTALVAQDAAAGDQGQRIEQVERMIRYRRDLVRLLRNFVNFSELYGTRRSIFQAGTLFIDGRGCDLCLPVEDTAKHASVAGLAHAYLLYCDCTRKSGERRTIVAAVTGGPTDNLMVGRNGVFCDRKGNDWDATVTRIVENPIGIRQAFWSPYKRLVRLVEEQVAKRASDADAELHQKAQSAALATARADQSKPGAGEKKPAPKKIDVGTVAAIGVAVAGVATFLSSVLAIFFGLGKYMPLGLLALLLGISGPSMLIAWLKLRQRNIGPILDANGWSVNTFARLNLPFGAALTQVAALPRGSRRELHDPFAEKRRPWKTLLVLLALLALGAAWYVGYLDANLPVGLRPHDVLGR